MAEDYKPGQLPYPEQDERKRFCEFHYKGVLIILIPLLLSPILLGPEVLAYRMIYLTICIYLYYIFNVMAHGAIAFLFIVFMPICGITTSKALCTAHYSDLIFEVYGSVFIGIAMDVSNLSERFAIIVIKLVGGNLRLLQILLTICTGVTSILFENPFMAAFWMKVAQAVIAEYAKAGILTADSDEETYERQAKPYPSWPVIGIYLTICYSANLGAMMSPFQNPNGIIYTIFNIFLKESPKGFLLVFVLPTILGLIVVALWINIIFLGLLGFPEAVKDQVKAAAGERDAMKKAMSDKKDAMGPWSIHSILVLVFIFCSLFLFVTRRPLFFQGWDDQIHLANCGASVAVILIQPDKPGTTPSLVGWKTVNLNTPWAHIFMLAAGHGFAVGLRDSKLLQLFQESLVRRQPDAGFCFFIASTFGTLFSILAPATVLARITLLTMFKTGVLTKTGTGSVAVPYAASLHNQFLLPCSSAANTIVSGWGNIRPFQYLIGGIVPAIATMLFIGAFVKLFGEDGFPDYLNVADNNDFKYTYKP
ncbi:hypothetical protein ACLKA6_013824 [Drosophila palustris]